MRPRKGVASRFVTSACSGAPGVYVGDAKIGALGYGLVMHALVTAIIGALALLVFFTLKSMREEAWLERRYAGYAAYRARTRRMIPYLY